MNFQLKGAFVDVVLLVRNALFFSGDILGLQDRALDTQND